MGAPLSPKVLIVGGGISGLSAAWFLHRKGHPVRLLEGDDRVGGVIASVRERGFLFERGPNSTLLRAGAEGGALTRLAQETGLSARLTPASPASDRRYVMRGGRLHALPGSPPAFLRSPLFSWRAKLALLREPFVARGKGEETIARFAERRLGRELLDYAVQPFVSGIYAGDAATLSVRAAVPRVYELEARYGSLIRGAIALRRAGKGAAGPAGGLISFDGGMEALPQAIAAALPEGSVATGCRVTALERRGEGWEVGWRRGGQAQVEGAARLVLALPAGPAAELLAPLSAAAAGLLRDIAYAPMVTVGLGYPPGQVDHGLDGFGFLAPRSEGLRVLGALFSSSLFPGRAPPGKVLITAFVGGASDPGALDLADRELVRQVQGDLGTALGARGEPEVVGLTRHAGAVAQYALGHLDRVAELDRLLAALPGLYTRASWRDGVSVADCVSAGERLAEAIG